MYTNFEDEIGDGQTVSLAGFDGGPNYERFLRKVRVYVLSTRTISRYARSTTTSR